MSELTGQPVNRTDGRLKVTGAATYAAEFKPQNMAHAVTVQSTVSRGHVSKIDTKAAEKAPGVILVITSKNALMLHQPDGNGDGRLGEKDLLPLQSDRIHYDGQHIAVVVAETFEQAEYAASLIKVDYDLSRPEIDIERSIAHLYEPKQSMGRELQIHRGDINKGLAEAGVKISETYSTPVYHHNPMEPHATIAEWNGDELTVYDATQGVMGTRGNIAQLLGISPEKVKVISLFLGGGFGCKGFMWGHTVLAPMAAKMIGRPVKIVLSRQQMFTCNGHRSRTIQKIALGATKDGKLTAVQHNTIGETSFVDEFVETAGIATQLLYSTPNLEVTHKLVRLNKGTPTPTRAPGEAPGTYALEAAMDELAYKLNIDPVQLRLINYAEVNEQNHKPWSSKNLRECYQRGAELIGWNDRRAEPGTQRQGKYLVGYGMATCTYPANRSPASARVKMMADGRVLAYSATQDIGTGTYTIMTQTVADALGIPLSKITFRLGDSTLPKAPNSGGSQSAASVGPAVRAAALGVRSKAIKLATSDKISPLYGYSEEDIYVDNGLLIVKPDPVRAESYLHLMKRHKLDFIEDEVTTQVSTRETKGGGDDKKKAENEASKADEAIDRKQYHFQSFGAVFVRVLVDPAIGKAHVDKCAAVIDAGRIMNMKTAKNQIMGGMIFALGMALMEETAYDPNNARVVTRDLAQYLVPVNADMPQFEVQFIDKPDPYISPIGARGIGEIGITGTTAAIVNAIYNATGRRVRDLPVTPDKLI